MGTVTTLLPVVVPLVMARLAWALALAVVAVLSLLPRTALPEPVVSDKIEHLCAYVVLGGLGGLASRGRPLGVFVALFAFGAGLEALQTLVPGRFGDLADVLANAAGALLGLVAARHSRRLVRVRG